MTKTKRQKETPSPWKQAVKIYVDTQLRSGLYFDFQPRGQSGVKVAKYLLDNQRKHLHKAEVHQLQAILLRRTVTKPSLCCSVCNILMADQPVVEGETCPICKKKLDVIVPHPEKRGVCLVMPFSAYKMYRDWEQTKINKQSPNRGKKHRDDYGTP